MDFFTTENTSGYTAAGLRALNRARTLIAEEHGFDIPELPESVRREMDCKMRDRLTNTHGRNLSVRMLLSLWYAE